MATQKNAQTQASFDVENLDDDALLQIEKELREKMQAIVEARKAREDGMKKKAFNEVEEVIKKHISILEPAEFGKWLSENKYIEAIPSKIGRRKINDADILFQKVHTPEGATKKLTLKFDIESNLPAANSKAFEALQEVRKLPNREIKDFFTPKFYQDFKTQNKVRDWTEEFFPNFFMYLVNKEEEEEEEFEKNQKKETENSQ